MTGKCFQHVKLMTGLMAGLVIAACSNMPGFTGSGPNTTNGRPPQQMADNVVNALCSGQAETAVAILSTEPLASPTDRFYTAYALEKSGHPARARQLYVNLMQSGASDHVRIRCGNQILADGMIADEAAKRLATVSQNLALLDANLRPNQPLHSGLPPSTTRTQSDSGTNNSYSGPVMQVTAPGSQSPFGQWFAHLASYMSLENAEKNKGTLEAQFPALAGIIDQWEVNAGGRRAIRLGIRVQNRADAVALCNAVKSQGEYCAVIDTST